MDNIEHDDANLIATSSTNQYIFEASKPELTREWAIAMNKLVL
jgi:hypothetical protein